MLKGTLLKEMKIRIIISAALVHMLIMLTACTAGTTSGDSSPSDTQTASDTLSSTIQTTTAATTTTTAEITTTIIETTTADTTTTAEEIPFEDTAENAYARLAASFKQPDGGEEAPEDYGGVFSYAGELTVCITTAEPSEYYTGLFSEYTCVRYKTVKHSFAELEEICAAAQSVLEPVYGVADVYVDVPANKAAITIAEGNISYARNDLRNSPDFDYSLDLIEVSSNE